MFIKTVYNRVLLFIVVWQKKVQFIVMLTNSMEENKSRYAHYWPENMNSSEYSGKYGHFNVTNVQV